MNILAILFAFIVSSYAAADKTECTLVKPSEERELYKAKAPTVAIFPGTGTEDEVQVEFTVPSLIPGKPDQLKRYKIKDKDGSVNLILLNYLARNSDLAPRNLDELLLAALEKHRNYWESAAKDKSVDPILVENALAMNKYIAKAGKTTLTDDERKKILTDVLGPFIDYDTNLKFEYKDVESGRYVSRPAKRLADIFPPEFYDVAVSTSAAGVLKDRSKAGVSTCEYLPVLGRLPKAGKVETIHRPGQR